MGGRGSGGGAWNDSHSRHAAAIPAAATTECSHMKHWPQQWPQPARKQHSQIAAAEGCQPLHIGGNRLFEQSSLQGLLWDCYMIYERLL